jgi:hypothetical protein
MTAGRELRIDVGGKAGSVSALLRRPRDAQWLLVLAHGAGAGMHHDFMNAISDALARRGCATLRYQFPYMEAGRRAPSPRPVLLATVRAAIEKGAKLAGDLPLLAGGKSMGGRMTSLVAAEQTPPGVRGLVFLGFPLHPAGKPSSERAAHLPDVRVPMLFLQGTRDKLAEPDRLRPILRALGRRATLHEIEEGDHSFHAPKRTGKTDADVIEELADAVTGWAGSLS